MHNDIVLVLVLVAFLGIGAQWFAWRFHIPAIVLLSAAGLIAGPGLGILHPSEVFGDLLRPFIQLGVAVILFEGGLNLRIHELKEAGSAVRRLVMFGIPLAWILGSAAAFYIGYLSLPVALVFGAIIVVTGPTVIMPLLRQAKLRQRPASLLKWEAIVNDPLGALLAVLVYEFFVLSGTGGAVGEVIGGLAWSLVTSALLGFGGGYLLAQAFRAGYVPEFLKGPMMLAMVVLVYGLANVLQDEAGLLATTTLGIVIGNARLASIDELRRFKESITILLVSAVFVLLTADLDPKILAQLDWPSAALLLTIVFVVRPLTIMLATINAGVELRERILIAWIAPRGIVAAAVAGAFAPALADLGFHGAEKLFPLIFTLILLTVMLHGFSIGWLARRFDLAASQNNGVLLVGASPWSIELAQALKALELPVILADSSWHRLRPARVAGLPVYYGQIISESAEESLELNSIGYLFAATDNDAYNALVCTRFANDFGRNSVYQLPTLAAEDDPKGLSPTLRGNLVIGDKAIYEELLRAYFQGWRFQKTRLTETYTFENYRADYGDDVLVFMLLRPDGQIRFNTVRGALEPKADDTVLAFMPERPKAQESAT